jgi:hypothetical protein
MAIVNEHLKTTFVEALAVPASTSYAITNILVCNNGTADANFDIHLVPQNGVIDNTTTRIINNLTLPPGETFTFDSEKIVLGEFDKIVFQADPVATYSAAGPDELMIGKDYVIVTAGSTNFTLVGATDNNPGTIFTATGTTTGTGTARLNGYTHLAATISYLEV